MYIHIHICIFIYVYIHTATQIATSATAAAAANQSSAAAPPPPASPGNVAEEGVVPGSTGEQAGAGKYFGAATEHLFMTLCALEDADLTHCGAFREV